MAAVVESMTHMIGNYLNIVNYVAEANLVLIVVAVVVVVVVAYVVIYDYLNYYLKTIERPLLQP